MSIILETMTELNGTLLSVDNSVLISNVSIIVEPVTA